MTSRNNPWSKEVKKWKNNLILLNKPIHTRDVSITFEPDLQKTQLTLTSQFSISPPLSDKSFLATQEQQEQQKSMKTPPHSLVGPLTNSSSVHLVFFFYQHKVTLFFFLTIMKSQINPRILFQSCNCPLHHGNYPTFQILKSTTNNQHKINFWWRTSWTFGWCKPSSLIHQWHEFFLGKIIFLFIDRYTYFHDNFQN